MSEVVLLASPEPPMCEVSEGFHNTNYDQSLDRVIKGNSYRPLGTVCITPTRDGMLRKRFVEARDGLLKAPNHAWTSWLVEGMEVGEAFNRAIWGVLQNPDLMKWNNGRGPWIATLEDDMVPPPDAFVKLLGDMYETPFAAVSALYWCKGESFTPQIWGNPRSYTVDFSPQPPADGLVECRGIGMGCAVWDIKLFQDERNYQGKYPDGCPIWFKTWSEVTPTGVRCGTQDLSQCELASRNGYRFAVDCRVRCGHMDSTGRVW